MNYNANTGPRQATFGKRVKRVSDVTAMGYNSYSSPSPPPNIYPNLDPNADVPLQAASFQQGYTAQPFDRQSPYPQVPIGTPNPAAHMSQSQQPYPNTFPMAPNFGVLGTPVVQDMAMQYGQQLAGAGKTMLKQEVEKYIPVSSLKYYFAVDTKYVLSKLTLLFFPFTHSDWSVKYQQDGPVQPRYEINAPDLYIPLMAYVTYILVAGLVLGMQDRFTPEQIGITASSAFAWCVVELAIYCAILYIMQVETSLKTFDLLAYSGYKFVGTIASILMSLIGGKLGYYATLIYTNLALAFFLIRSLKVQVLAEHSAQGSSSTGHKRRLYFLLFVAGAQSVLSWWLSFHLVHSGAPVVKTV